MDTADIELCWGLHELCRRSFIKTIISQVSEIYKGTTSNIPDGKEQSGVENMRRHAAALKDKKFVNNNHPRTHAIVNNNCIT